MLVVTPCSSFCFRVSSRHLFAKSIRASATSTWGAVFDVEFDRAKKSGRGVFKENIDPV
jgi:hypothetical protein